MYDIINKKRKLTFIILSLAIAFSFSIGIVTADQSQIYVNPAGNDSWDGQYATWQNTTYGPKQTIKNATGTAATNGNVYVANGTYNENSISINRNMNIIGESKDGTIINGTNTAGIFSVSGGATVTFTNLTLTNGNTTAGGGISSSGANNITVINCIFQNGLARGSGGGAIFSQGVYSSTNPGYITVSDCTFIDNKAAGGTSYAGSGGAIANFLSTLTVTNSNFIRNSVTGVQPRGGAIHNSAASAIVQFCRFINNTGTTGSNIYFDNLVGSFNAQYNWWGSNTGPAAGSISGSVSTTPWLVLTAPTGLNIATSSSSIIIGDLQHDSAGAYHNPVNGHVPDGIPVTFTGGALGSVNPTSDTSFNGLLTTTFTSGATTGTSIPTFTVDIQSVNGNINIASLTPTNLAVDPQSGYKGDLLSLTATLRDALSNPINGAVVNFIVNDASIGNTTTDVSGVATLPYTINLGAGIYTILAQFLGDATYSGSTGTNNLTVNYIPTTMITSGPVDTYYRDMVNLTATLTDFIHGTPVSGQTIYFNINGNATGAALTNAFGVATLQYTLTQGATTYQLLARFLGDKTYSGSNATNSFTLIPTSTALTVSQSTATYFNYTATLTANLTDTVHGIPIRGKNITFNVNGTPIGSAITTVAGIATLTYTNALMPGTYPILAQFAGDTGYILSNGTGNLIVSLRPTGFYNPSSLTAYYNTTVTLTARLRDNSFNYLNNKTVAFWIVQNGIPIKIGETITTTVSGNIGTATLPYIAAIMPGTYQIITEFAGDAIYNASNATYNLIVNYNPTKLNVTNKSGYFMDTTNLTATLKDTPNNNLTGMTVVFKVNGTQVGTAVTDATGIATLPYTINLGAGIYQILAQFAAIGGYNASNSTANLTVSAAPSSIIVNSVNTYFGDLVNLTATLTDPLHSLPISGKNVTFSINGTPAGSAQTDASGTATIPNYLITQNVGLYLISAQFAGDNTYVTSNSTNTLNVNYIPTLLILSPLSGLNSSIVNLTATFTNMHNNASVSGRTINFILNGVSIGSNFTDASGVATLQYVLVPGIYIAQFTGDTIYASSTGSMIPSVLYSTQLIVGAVSGSYGSTVNLTASLTNTIGGAPLSGKLINFSVNNTSVGGAVTDASGTALLPYTVPLTTGIYPILAQFAGDSIYGPSSGINNLTVNGITTQIIVSPITAYYNNTVNLTANLTDIQNNVPLSGQQVNFSVNGAFINSAVTDNLGIATLPYTLTLSAGIYEILAEFAGDPVYGSSSGINNLTVNGIPTQILVSSITGYYNNAVNLTANLTDTLNNVPVSGKIVIFTVNGSSVGNATTNASGITTLQYIITQPAGIYSIFAEFAGDGIYVGSNGTNNLTVLPVTIVVWQDNRDGTNWHIYYEYIETGQTGRVTGFDSNQLNPAISGNIVVWEDNRDGSGTSHIYFKNLITGQTGRVTGVNSNQYSPAISGNIVVWEDNRDGSNYHIYYKKLDTGAGGRVTGFDSNQLNPAISGNIVVWEDNRDGSNLHIYYKNLTTGINSRVTGFDSNQLNPAISGNNVVWQDNRNGPSTSIIYYKKLDTGASGRISAVNSTQLNPAISGSNVVWQDNRDGTDYHIYYQNLNTGTNSRITGINSNQTNPTISTSN